MRTASPITSLFSTLATMNKHFYKIPLDFSSIFTNGTLSIPSCSEMESIDQYIDLLLSTYPGEHQFNKNWGCRIWEMDFVNVKSRKQWEDDFVRYAKEAIARFEKRLKDVAVEIHIAEVSHSSDEVKAVAIKKRVTIYVNAHLVSTGEKCGFRYIIYLGPLSTD